MHLQHAVLCSYNRQTEFHLPLKNIQRVRMHAPILYYSECGPWNSNMGVTGHLSLGPLRLNLWSNKVLRRGQTERQQASELTIIVALLLFDLLSSHLQIKHAWQGCVSHA